MSKLGSRKLHICPKVTKMGSIIGHRIDYNGLGALRGERHIPSKMFPEYPPPPRGNLTDFLGVLSSRVDRFSLIGPSKKILEGFYFNTKNW